MTGKRLIQKSEIIPVNLMRFPARSISSWGEPRDFSQTHKSAAPHAAFKQASPSALPGYYTGFVSFLESLVPNAAFPKRSVIHCAPGLEPRNYLWPKELSVYRSRILDSTVIRDSEKDLVLNHVRYLTCFSLISSRSSTHWEIH